jgi:hypothetical protein
MVSFPSVWKKSMLGGGGFEGIGGRTAKNLVRYLKRQTQD